jgi:hypothetical protein
MKARCTAYDPDTGDKIASATATNDRNDSDVVAENSARMKLTSHDDVDTREGVTIECDIL